MNVLVVSLIIKNLLMIYRKTTSSELKNKCPSDEKIDRTKEIIKRFNIKNGELTRIKLKSRVFFAYVCV